MILVTGGAGYIGSHTILNLLEDNKEIIVFDNLENGHIETIHELQKNSKIKFVKGDLRNINDIDNLFTCYKIDAVIHFAAYALVGESMTNPAKYYRNNVLGSLNLLDTMVKHNVKHIIFSSTCATYGNPLYIPIDENHPQNPINPYGSSKLMVEKILEDYDKAYGVKSIKLRYFNVAGCDSLTRIGELHNPETHLIPNILKSANDNKKTFKIFGTDYNTPDGTCIRDYVNIEDLAEAHKLAYYYLLKENKSDVFNIGTSKGDSVKTVFNVCEKIINKKIPLKYEDRRPGDPATLYANYDKAKNILKWCPQKSIEDSVLSAFQWERKITKMSF